MSNAKNRVAKNKIAIAERQIDIKEEKREKNKNNDRLVMLEFLPSNDAEDSQDCYEL
jgi:hypothetical protein